MPSLAAEAGAAHQAGDLGRAEILWREHLQRQPADREGLLDLAAVLWKQGRPREAMAPLQQVLRLEPDHRLALNRLGAVLQQLGDLEQAQAVLEQATRAHPDHGEAWCNLGIVLLSRGGPQALAAARRALERTLALGGDQALPLRALVRTLRLLGRPQDAVDPALRLARIDPSQHRELLALGQELQLQERHQEAEPLYRMALSCVAAQEAGAPQPGSGGEDPGGEPPLLAVLHSNLGAARLALDRHAEARDDFARALELWPSYPEAQANLGLALRLLGRDQEALAACDQALLLRPGFAAAHSGRGLALRQLGRSDEALQALQEAVRLDPGNSTHLSDLALCHQDRGRCQEALRLYDLALQPSNPVRPNDPAATRMNRGMCRLLASELREGWDDYEFRLQRRQCTIQLTPSGPRWQGGSGGALLLVGEQGHGDMLQFLRYAPLLRRRVDSLALCLPPNLIPLARAAGLADAVWTPAQAASHRGPWLPLLSVCAALQTTPQQLAAAVPYLQVPEALIASWRQRLQLEPRPLIALHWQGNPEMETGGQRGRSLPLETLAPLSRVAPLRLVSLQKGAGSEQLPVCTFRASFVAAQEQVDRSWDFLDSAAILRCCTLLITADSGLAHLAGGLGVPVWLLLKRVPDWRWGLQGETTLWYPSMRLFRQRREGDWPELIARVSRALAEHLEARPEPRP